MTDQTPFPETADAPDRAWWRQALDALKGWSWLWLLAPAAAAVILLYYPIGMALVHQIDDDPDFALPAGVTEPQSRAVAMASALVLREVDHNSWTPNDPFFKPSWALDNMPNFQQGVVAAVRRFVVGLGERQDAAEIAHAAGLLKYPATVWMFDPRTSWAPTASTEKQYRGAARALAEFNVHASSGGVQLGRDAGTLRTLLAVVADDLRTVSADTERQLAEGPFVDLTVDDTFYATKGRLYAYSLLLRELGWDFAPVLAGGELGAEWRQMLETLRLAAALDPLVVSGGSPDGALPNHLTAQGFYLLRAETQIEGIIRHLAP